jgi:hypothetical protein
VSDAFDRAASTEPPPLKSRFISTGSVGVGEGIQFELTSIELVPDRFAADADAKVFEITGEVIESRADGLVIEGPVVITAKAIRLAQFAEEVRERAVPGSVITLRRGEDEGKAAGWRWVIEPPPGQGKLAEAGHRVVVAIPLRLPEGVEAPKRGESCLRRSIKLERGQIGAQLHLAQIFDSQAVGGAVGLQASEVCHVGTLRPCSQLLAGAHPVHVLIDWGTRAIGHAR